MRNRSTLWRGVLIVPHGRSRMAIGTPIPTMPGRGAGRDEDNRQGRQGRGAFIKRNAQSQKHIRPVTTFKAAKHIQPQHLI